MRLMVIIPFPKFNVFRRLCSSIWHTFFSPFFWCAPAIATTLNFWRNSGRHPLFTFKIRQLSSFCYIHNWRRTGSSQIVWILQHTAISWNSLKSLSIRKKTLLGTLKKRTWINYSNLETPQHSPMSPNNFTTEGKNNSYVSTAERNLFISLTAAVWGWIWSNTFPGTWFTISKSFASFWYFDS